MARIQPINRNDATGAVAATLDGVKAKIGTVPNLFATFARHPPCSLPVSAAPRRCPRVA